VKRTGSARLTRVPFLPDNVSVSITNEPTCFRITDSGPPWYVRMEFKLGVFLGSLWAILSMVMAALACVEFATEKTTGPEWTRYVACGITGLTVFVRFPLLVWIWLAVRDGATSMDDGVVCRYPRIPISLRPFVALWWLYEFACGVFLAFVFEGVINDHASSDLLQRLWPLRMLLSATSIYAVNIFLLLIVATCTRKPAAYRWLWRQRFAIDVFFFVFSLAYANSFQWA
jgi:hypothetical protein